MGKDGVPAVAIDKPPRLNTTGTEPRPSLTHSPNHNISSLGVVGSMGRGGPLELSTYIDRNSILYDAVQGFVIASLLCCLSLCLYRFCRCALVVLNICPDDRSRRRRGKGRYRLVTSADPDEDDDSVDSGSADSSAVSMEYGHCCGFRDEEDQSVDRFEEKHINRAASRYFDGKQRNKWKVPTERGVREETRKKKNRREGGSKGSLSNASILDNEFGDEEPPLDLQMIERKIVESMGDSYVMPASFENKDKDEGSHEMEREIISSVNVELLTQSNGDDNRRLDSSEKGISGEPYSHPTKASFVALL